MAAGLPSMPHRCKSPAFSTILYTYNGRSAPHSRAARRLCGCGRDRAIGEAPPSAFVRSGERDRAPMTIDAAGRLEDQRRRDLVRQVLSVEVEVFARSTGHVEHNLVTDPYSTSLSRNSARSQITTCRARR